jgi:large subunit ribosomal protein L28
MLNNESYRARKRQSTNSPCRDRQSGLTGGSAMRYIQWTHRAAVGFARGAALPITRAIEYEEHIMSMVCDICGKGKLLGNRVSHANNRKRRIYKPNLQRVRANVNGVHMHLRVCTDCISANRVQKIA